MKIFKIKYWRILRHYYLFLDKILWFFNIICYAFFIKIIYIFIKNHVKLKSQVLRIVKRKKNFTFTICNLAFSIKSLILKLILLTFLEKIIILLWKKLNILMVFLFVFLLNLLLLILILKKLLILYLLLLLLLR